MIFGERIKKLRKSYKLSRPQLVKNIDKNLGVKITEQSLCAYESNLSVPSSRSKIRGIAHFFQMPISYFFEEDKTLLSIIYFYGLLDSDKKNKLKQALHESILKL